MRAPCTAAAALFAVVAVELVELVGCGPPSWHPAPPQGVTYRYEDQGFIGTSTTVVAGAGPAGGYAAAFNFRGAPGVKGDVPDPNPFEQAAPIDGLHFNEHLAGQGTQLQGGSIPARSDQGR